MEQQCTFCDRIVVDDSGNKTGDFGTTRRGKHICARCMRAFEFSLGR